MIIDVKHYYTIAKSMQLLRFFYLNFVKKLYHNDKVAKFIHLLLKDRDYIW